MPNKKGFERINNAVIDLGSNSIRMLVFRRGKDGKLFQVCRSLEYTKLAQDVSKTGLLSQEAINRNINALDKFEKIARDYDVHHVYLFGTNAMRDAKNSSVLSELIKDKFGLTVHIISGKQEAEYGFTGVAQTHHGEVLIFDIGGGSTELISGSEKIQNLESLQLGCVRCSDDFITDQNKVDPAEVKKLFNYCFEKISNTLKEFTLPKEFELIGIGGTITTLASVLKKLDIYDSSQIHNTVITYEQMRRMLEEFCSTDLNSRKEIKGLPEKRVDTIIAGTTIAMAILKASKKTRCHVSDFDNLEGAAYLKFLKENPKEWDNQEYKKLQV